MRKVLLIILFFISFTLTGCVKMDVTQEIDKNGLANIKVSYDITKMNTLKEEMKKDEGSGFKFSDSSKEPCSGTGTGSNELNLTNYKCTIVDKDHYTVEGQFDFNKSKNFYTEKGIYIYNLSKGFNDLNSKNNNSGKVKTKEEIEQEKKMLIAMGIEANISLKMPGIIIKNDIGNLENNVVHIDYIDLISLDSYYIVSKDNDVNLTDLQTTEILNKFKASIPNVDTTDQKDKSKYLKQKILLASALKKAKQERYITQIDKLVEKTDNKKLKLVFDKIQKLKNKNNIINYLESVIYLKLNNSISPNTQQDTNNNITSIKNSNEDNSNGYKKITQNYSSDGESIYYLNGIQGSQKLKGIDINKYKIICEDKMKLIGDGNVFYESIFKLDYAFDLSTLTCIGDKYTKDKNGFYYVSLSKVKKLEKIDKKSFGVNSNGILYDKNGIYFLNLKLNYNFDIESVKKTGHALVGDSGYVNITDKNGTYSIDIKSMDKGDYKITKK